MNDQDKTNDELIKKLHELQQENNNLKASNNNRMAGSKAAETGPETNCNELSEIKAEEEANEFAENIINTLREPLLILDQDLRVVKASRSFYHFFKVCDNETVGQLVYELGNNQWNIPELRELLETILPEKTTFDDYEVEHNFSAIGKRVMLLNARQIKRAFGKEKIILLAFEDITERKSAEELINEKSRISTEYLDILLNHAHAPIIIWDASWVIKRFNHEFEKLSGYKSTEVIDKKLDILFPEDKKDSTLELLNERLGGEDPEVIEIEILTKDKEVKTVLWNSANIFDKEGTRIVSTIAQDISSRKQTEVALRNSDTLLRTLVHSIPDLIWLKDNNGVYLSCNPMFERFFGAKEADIIGKTDFDFVDQELAVFFRENDRKAMEAGMPTSNEEWVTFADDGHQAYLETIKTPMYDSTGILLGVLGIGRDITERKYSEELVQKQKDEFETIFNLVPAQIWYKDTRNNFIRVNRQVCIDLGMTNDNIEGHSAEELFPSFAQQYFKDDLEVFNTRIAKLGIIEQINTSKGEIRWVTSDKIPVFDNDGEINGLILVVQDITGRKRAEEENIMLAHSLKSVNECVSITDLDNKILFVNESFLKTYGYDLNELIGKNISLVNSIYNRQEQVKEISLATIQGEWQGELLNKKKDGSEFPIYLSTSVIKDKESNVIGLIGVATDITGRKQTEEKLVESEEKYRAFFENSMDAILLTSADGRIYSANPAACSMFGYSEEELIKVGRAGVVDVTDPRLPVYLAERKLSGNAQGELTLLRKGSTRFPAEISSAVFKNQDGHEQTSMIIRDITVRIESEKALRQSEKKFRSYIDNAPDGIFVVDETGRFSEVNTAACTTSGYSRNEFLSMSISDVLSEESFEDGLATFNTLLQNGNSKSDLSFNHKDGSIRWLSLDAVKLTESTFLGFTKDITERKQIVEKLKESEEQFRKLYENAKIGLYRTTPGGAILMANKALVTLLGFSSFEMLATRDLENDGFGPKYNRKEFLEKFENGGEVDNFESEWIRLDGSKILVQESAQAIRDSHGNILYFDGVIEDITERRRAEETLLKLSSAVEQTVDSIMITGRNGMIEYVNHAFELLTGYPSEEVLGKTPRILKSGIQNHIIYKELWRTILSGKVYRAEFVNKKKNGVLYNEEKTISPIFDKNKNITHFVGTGVDITKRKLAEIELIEAKNRAEQSDRLKTAFLTNMSHEIRTPLNGILGFTGLLKEPKLSGVQQQEYVRIIEKSGKRMLNIISDIISISIVESGNLRTDIAAMDVNNQIQFLSAFFKPEAIQKGIEIYCTRLLPPNESVILTDQEKVNSILSNLIKNALKFTHTGSIEFGCEKKGPYLEYFVKDTGTGIVEEKMEIIFERFRQGSEANTRNYEGAGLGLSISKAYAEVLGGKIWVESEEGKGSIFYFTIPYKAATEVKFVENNAALTDVPVNEPRKLKILIAEDDESSELLLRIVLSVFSDTILTAATGVEALEVCHNNPDIDLVLMDIKMPDMDGLEATRQIRQFNKEVIIIAQTAFALDGDKEMALEAGCNDYISKPVNVALIKLLIQKHFYKKEGE